MFVASNNSSFNSRTVLTSSSIRQDQECAVGRFTNCCCLEPLVIPLGCIIMTVINIAQFFFSLFCCECTYEISYR